MDKPLNINVDQVSQELHIRPDAYVRIASGFAESLNAKLLALHNALKVNNSEEMRKILHEIKGTAGNLRLSNIAEAQGAMHTAVKNSENKETLHDHLQVLTTEVEKLQQSIQQLSRPSA